MSSIGTCCHQRTYTSSAASKAVSTTESQTIGNPDLCPELRQDQPIGRPLICVAEKFGLRGLLTKWRIEHERLEIRLEFGRAVRQRQQVGGVTAVSRFSLSWKWTNGKAIGGEIDSASPNSAGDVFHRLYVRRRPKRDVEAGARGERFAYWVGSFIEAKRSLRRESLAIGPRNLEASGRGRVSRVEKRTPAHKRARTA